MVRKLLVKKILKFVLGAVLIVFTARFCQKQTDGFALYKIQSNFLPRQEWATSLPDSAEREEIFTILKQPFHYLAKGAQSYVFESEDGKYVIKFFRIYHLRAPLWLTALPLPGFLEGYRQEKIARKNQELTTDFNSYKIAYDELKKETGIVYLHLNKTTELQTRITIFDKIGIAHELNLDEMEFLLQKKVDLLYPGIEKLMQNGESEKAKRAITDLITLLAKRCQKGIFDKDPDLNTNFGLLDAMPIQLDIGRYRRDPNRANPEIYKNDIIRTTDHFHQWLEERYPELDAHLMQTIKTL